MNTKTLIIILIVVVLGVGGYVFLSNNQVTIAPKVINSPTSVPAAVTSMPTTVSTIQPAIAEDLKTIVKQLLVAKHGPDAAELNITVSKTEGNYVSGGASASGGGGMWFATKAGGVWKLVWDGNGTISCTDLAPYPDLPTSMIPECWNETTKKSQIR